MVKTTGQLQGEEGGKRSRGSVTVASVATVNFWTFLPSAAQGNEKENNFVRILKVQW